MSGRPIGAGGSLEFTFDPSNRRLECHLRPIATNGVGVGKAFVETLLPGTRAIVVRNADDLVGAGCIAELDMHTIFGYGLRFCSGARVLLEPGDALNRPVIQALCRETWRFDARIIRLLGACT